MNRVSLSTNIATLIFSVVFLFLGIGVFFLGVEGLVQHMDVQWILYLVIGLVNIAVALMYTARSRANRQFMIWVNVIQLVICIGLIVLALTGLILEQNKITDPVESYSELVILILAIPALINASSALFLTHPRTKTLFE